VPTQPPRSPAEHYTAALRLLAVAEGAHERSGDRLVAAGAAVAYALLAAASRRARRPEHQHGPSWLSAETATY
jgi:hypothetical protein